MYQTTTMSTGQALRRLPEHLRRGNTGPRSGHSDSCMHLDAWRRILDRQEPDCAG